MNQRPRFAEIRAVAVAAFGTPTSEEEIDGNEIRVSWGHDAVILVGTRGTVFFVHPRTSGAWWVVDDVTMKPTVTLADAINALRPIVRAE
jgi:hypothetical protein